MYNPLTDKKPQGAAEAGVPFIMEFPLPGDSPVRRVKVLFQAHDSEGEGFAEELFPVDTECGKLFRGRVTMPSEGIWHYRFEGYVGSEIFFFGRGDDGQAVRGDWLPNWQLTVTKKSYKTPDWAKGGIIYHIFADRFARGDDTVFDKKNGRLHANWEELPETNAPGTDYRADDFFGGNISGILGKLPYLKSLGVTLLYLSPVFESCSNHRYDTGDYMKIDGLLGSEDDFRALCSEAKAMGMDVMLDGVFNHTGADSLYFNKWGNYASLGAYQSKKSPYHDWYFFYDFPDGYHCWWGVTCVPTVNKAASGYKKLIFGKNGVLEKWTNAGVRAWRFDVVDELPETFVFELRRAAKKLNREELLVGEVWEDASTKVSYGTMRPYFLGEQLDGVMNYPFKNAILDYAGGGSVQGFKTAVTPIVEHYPAQSLAVCMTLVGTHDTVRALTALSGHDGSCMTKAQKMEYELTTAELSVAVPRLKIASAVQYFLPGIPSIYYGDEAGVQGFEDPSNRKTYPWGKENRELLEHYRTLGRFRTQHRQELVGDFRFEDCGNDDVLAFSRGDDQKRVYFAVNNTEKPQKIQFSCKNLLTDDQDTTIIAPFGYLVF